MRSGFIARLTTWLFAFLFLTSPIHLATATSFADPATELEFVRRLREATPPAQRPAVAHLTEMVPMTDGARLHTSIYLPSESGRYPAVLVRTPYNDATDGVDDYGYSGIADYYCPRGYAVVIQTIRGKYASEGAYRLLSRGEIDDGYTTIEWISRQAWCEGKVAVIGVSHDGFDADLGHHVRVIELVSIFGRLGLRARYSIRAVPQLPPDAALMAAVCPLL